MSGITGWIDHERDVAAHGLVVARLVADLVARGRRGEGLWLSRRAALGQRTDAAWTGPAGPARLEEGGRVLVAAVCDGDLHEPEEPRAASDHALTPAGRAPSEIVLSAYLRWGHGAAERLDGSFAFAIWDERTRELVLGRDRLGIRPLSYSRTPHGVVFSSEVAALVAHPLVAAEMDGEAFCALLTQVRSPGRGALRDVREVPSGCTVTIARDRETCRRYWSLEARPHTLDQEHTIARIRELLDDAVSRAMRGIAPAVLLSGGLDSSALTGLAALGAGRPPRTFTAVLADTSSALSDRAFAADVVGQWSCEHHEIAVETAELTDPVAAAAALSARDYPTPFGDRNVTPFLFSQRVAALAPVALSGEAADAMFGGALGAIDEGHRFTTFPWIERFRKYGIEYGIGTGLFDQELLRAVDLAGYQERTYREASAEVPHLPGSSRADRLVREVDYLVVTRLLEQAAHHSERLAGAAGLQVRFPFTDHRLFGFLHNVPEQMKSFDGREKSLLRAVAGELVPASVLRRAKVAYPISYDPVYKASVVERLRALLDDPAAPVRPLIDRAGARRVVDNPRLLDRGGWIGRADAEMVLHLDAWLRRLRVRICL